MSRTPRRALLALSSIAVLAAGCGENNDDPKSVLLKFTTDASCKCGAKNAGEVFDLTTNSSGQNRAEYIRNQLISEQQRGCTPNRVPHIEAIQLSRTDSVAVYDVGVENPSTGFKGGRARLIKTQGGWKVDTGRGT